MSPRYFILFQSMLIITVGQFSGYLYAPSLPAMVSALHTKITYVQLSLSLTLITYGAAQLIYGAASDYYGRRKPVVIGLVIFVIGSVITVITHSIDGLLLGRAIQGVGMGAVGLTRVINRDIFSGAEFLKVGSYVTMILAITPILAPLLGGYIQDYIGWRGNFVFLLSYACLILFIIYFKLPETNLNLRPGPPKLKIIFQAYAKVVRNKRFMALLCCSMLAFSSESVYTIMAPFLLQNQLGWSAIAYGWLGLFTVVGFLIGATIASKLSHSIQPENMLKIGSCITLAASLLMLVLSWQLNTWAIVLPMSLYMLGMSMVTIPCGVMAMSLYTKRLGVAGAAYGSVLMIGSGLISTFGTHFHVHNQRPLAILLTCLSLSIMLVFRECIS